MRLLMTFEDRAKSFWKAHGTKLLGYFTSAIGILQEVQNLIQQATPKYAGIALLLIGVGAAIVKRGHTNTRSLAEPLNETEHGV